MGSPSGEWVKAPPGVRVETGNVPWYTEQVHPQFVGLATSSQLILGLGFEQVLLLSLSGTATPALNGTLVECFGLDT